MVQKTWLLAAGTFAGLILMTMLALGSGSAVAASRVDSLQSTQAAAQVSLLALPDQQTTQVQQNSPSNTTRVEREQHEQQEPGERFDD